MKKDLRIVRREYPIGPQLHLTVLVAHAMLGDAPCVVLQEEGAAFGGRLFSAFEAVAGLYEVELRAKGIHPGVDLRFVQYRYREPAQPSPRAVYEEVVMKGLRGARYASSWTPLPDAPDFSGSSPTLGWPAHRSRPA